jgi:hypothetical protein
MPALRVDRLHSHQFKWIRDKQLTAGSSFPLAGVRQAQGHRSPVPRLTERSRMPEGTSTDSGPIRLLPITMPVRVIPAVAD